MIKNSFLEKIIFDLKFKLKYLNINNYIKNNNNIFFLKNNPFIIPQNGSFPFYICLYICIFFITINFFINNNLNNFLEFTTLWFLFFNIFMWMNELLIESRIKRVYTESVQEQAFLGGILYILSETCLFAGYFWAFFHIAINPSIFIGGKFPYEGIVTLSPFMWPLVNTLSLLYSGLFANIMVFNLNSNTASILEIKSYNKNLCTKYSINCESKNLNVTISRYSFYEFSTIDNKFNNLLLLDNKEEEELELKKEENNYFFDLLFFLRNYRKVEFLNLILFFLNKKNNNYFLNFNLNLNYKIIYLFNKLYMIELLKEKIGFFNSVKNNVFHIIFIEIYSYINSLILTQKAADISIIIGILFLMIQSFEYINNFNDISDGVFTSLFYSLTALHGLHVATAILFISILIYIYGSQQSLDIRYIFYKNPSEEFIKIIFIDIIEEIKNKIISPLIDFIKKK